MAHPPILHHYPSSPFAEKIRLVLGAKALAWRSVTIPVIMPKPDLVALTGGYRRTPVLQIGADVYCDTALIARVLDELAPAPALHPADRASAEALAQWADRDLFAAAVAYVFQPAGLQALFAGMEPAQVQAFVEDRKRMREGSPSPRMPLADALGVLHDGLARLESSLSDGRAHLLGSAPSIADFSAYHPLWFIERAPALAGILDAFPALADWRARMRAIGHGDPQAMSAAEAIEVARTASPARIDPTGTVDHHGLAPGARVRIAPTDYGIDPVEGVLVGSTATRLALRRDDPRAGEVVVHFPRLGYRLTPAS